MLANTPIPVINEIVDWFDNNLSAIINKTNFNNKISEWFFKDFKMCVVGKMDFLLHCSHSRQANERSIYSFTHRFTITHPLDSTN